MGGGGCVLFSRIYPGKFISKRLFSKKRIATKEVEGVTFCYLVNGRLWLLKSIEKSFSEHKSYYVH